MESRMGGSATTEVANPRKGQLGDWWGPPTLCKGDFFGARSFGIMITTGHPW